MRRREVAFYKKENWDEGPHGLRPQSRLQTLYGFVPLLFILFLQCKESLSLRKDLMSFTSGIETHELMWCDFI